MSGKVRLLVIEHAKGVGSGYIRSYLEKGDISYKWLKLYNEENKKVKKDFFVDLRRYQGVISLGGPGHIHKLEKQKDYFLVKEKEIIAEAAVKEKAILGVCYGAQIIAYALGAKIIPLEEKKQEIGWYPLYVNKEGRKSYFKGVLQNLIVFQWHTDTFSLPPGAKLLASSDLCQNQAFSISGKNILGLQFHPEVTQGMIISWKKDFADYLKTLPPERVAQFINKGRLLRQQVALYQILDNFFGELL